MNLLENQLYEWDKVPPFNYEFTPFPKHSKENIYLHRKYDDRAVLSPTRYKSSKSQSS